MTANPNIGFKLESNKEVLIWLKYQAWEKGISPFEFKKIQIRDLHDIIDIKNAMDEKSQREQNIQNMMRGMKFR